MTRVKPTIGIDIGGTKIAGGLVSADGEILRKERRETPAENPSQIVAAVSELVQELSKDADPTAVGVASAGYIDKAGATVLFAPNVAWRDEPLKERLAKSVDLPIRIENDANAAAYGEFMYGAGRDVDDMVMITVGTGVGGGVIADGRLLRGAFGIGGEIGHMRVVPDGIVCGCGNHGCLESNASGTALLREARALVASGSHAAAELSRRCGGDPDELRGQDVTAAAQSGDPASIELLAELGQWLGEGAASLAAVLDPGLFVVGGGVAEAGDLLLLPMAAAYQTQLTGATHRPIAEFKIAALGNDAGLVGAAALVREDG